MKANNENVIELDGARVWRALLTEWRIWLIGAATGSLLALIFFFIAPPDYRARATVVVDQNVEEAWAYFPDRQLFQFVRRETARLVELAWSDGVLNQLQAFGFSNAELRENVLQLSQPADGGWHFYGMHADPKMAADLTNAWAEAFVATIAEAISANPELQAARQALDDLVLSNPEPNDTELLALSSQIAELAESTRGVSPYVEAYLSQSATIGDQRSPDQASYLLVGALIGLLSAALLSLFSVGNAQIKK